MNKKGFTLIELFITASITAVISLAIFSAFAAGLKIYERLSHQGKKQVESSIFIEKMERDLRNTFEFSGIDFYGEAQRVDFAAKVRVAEQEGVRDSLAKISYYFDSAAHNLTRQEYFYPRLLIGEAAEAGRYEQLAGIESVEYSYYYYDPETETFNWKDTWVIADGEENGEIESAAPQGDDGLPLAVKFQVKFEPSFQLRDITRVAFIFNR